MNDMLNNILENSDKLPGVTLKNSPNSRKLLLNHSEGNGKMIFHTICPGLTIALVYADTFIWPESESNQKFHPLLLNYCLFGRCELLLDDNTYVYLQEKEYCISCQSAQNKYIFPTGKYRGLKVYFDLDTFTVSCKEILEAFDIDLWKLQRKYIEKKNTYICETDDTERNILTKLWKFSEKSSYFHMKLYLFELLYYMLISQSHTSKRRGFYTKTQVEIAKKAHQILTSDLRKHLPIRVLANEFSVSETSLKNYFKGVYGQNISSYMRKKRMDTAAEMLSETRRPISEISIQVGYSNQGKFASVFKKQFGFSPLEYRRIRYLEKNDMSPEKI